MSNFSFYFYLKNNAGFSQFSDVYVTGKIWHLTCICDWCAKQPLTSHFLSSPFCERCSLHVQPCWTMNPPFSTWSSVFQALMMWTHCLLDPSVSSRHQSSFEYCDCKLLDICKPDRICATRKYKNRTILSPTAFTPESMRIYFQTYALTPHLSPTSMASRSPPARSLFSIDSVPASAQFQLLLLCNVRF